MAATTSVDRPAVPAVPAVPADRWDILTRGTLFAVLPAEERGLVRTVHDRYRLTVQEMRLLCEAARDLQMWGVCGGVLPKSEWRRQTGIRRWTGRRARVRHVRASSGS